MATYKKRGAKKSISKAENQEQQIESTTAEVFETLDVSASKTEAFVAKYQNVILTLIGVVSAFVLGYMAYDAYVQAPQREQAVSDLNQAQYYFNLANSSEDNQTLYNLAINGGQGKYGFLDIIENYSGTPAAELATYSTGMAYLNLKEYEKAITYLSDFSADDIMLSALANGATGDAYAALNQPDQALKFYKAAIDASDNSFTSPKYLFKAGMISAELNKKSEALAYFKRIESDFPEAQEANQIQIQIGRLEVQ